jgi:hypothetical protein
VDLAPGQAVVAHAGFEDHGRGALAQADEIEVATRLDLHRLAGLGVEIRAQGGEGVLGRLGGDGRGQRDQRQGGDQSKTPHAVFPRKSIQRCS